MTSARKLALEVLLEVERGAFADAVLGQALDTTPLEASERRLATILVYGTLARQLTIDHSLQAYCSRRLGKLEHRVLVLLRLGLFQIVFLDRVPAYAAVHSSVDLARTVAPNAAGLINAVLRRAAKQGLAPAEGDETDRLAVEHSHPPWLVARWLSELGRTDALALMTKNNEPMPTVLRALLSRDEAIADLRRAGVDARGAGLAPDGIVVDRAAGRPGIAIAQGEASQLVTLLVGARPGDSILDACAGSGGKTAYLAALAGPSGSVLAVDPSRGMAERIARVARFTGVGNVDAVEARIEELEPRAPFDAVLVDAPCSGLGTLREHPEIRWRRSEADIEQLASRQLSILRAASAHVAAGGRLVYATCTLLRAENEAVIDAFLADAHGFGEDVARDFHPALEGLVDERGRLRTLPHVHDTDGFFAVRLRRR